MKIKLLVVSALLSLSLIGCGSSVSQEDYDSLQSKYYSLKDDYDTLKASYDVLSNRSADITEDIPAQNKIFSESYVGAAVWVATAFGEDAKYCELGVIGQKSGNTLQVYVPTEYSASDASKVFDDVKSSMTSLAISGLEYEYISIKFLYPDSTELIDIGLSLDNGDYVLSYISGDLMNASDIINSLN